MDDRELHAGLIGQQGSRAALNTPVLVLDIEALDRNIAAMAALAAERGVEMPVAEMVAALVEARIGVQDAVAALLSRPLKEE